MFHWLFLTMQTGLASIEKLYQQKPLCANFRVGIDGHRTTCRAQDYGRI